MRCVTWHDRRGNCNAFISSARTTQWTTICVGLVRHVIQLICNIIRNNYPISFSNKMFKRIASYTFFESPSHFDENRRWSSEMAAIFFNAQKARSQKERTYVRNYIDLIFLCVTFISYHTKNTYAFITVIRRCSFQVCRILVNQLHWYPP